ncbi:DoxX family protein [Nocardioides sp. R-C-SC26]|uniref:DoxX family protein n=1 Tax=Nocardioides sp. R-C-SC26 TaxID=2870414 RepID=UPI001E5C14FF|nr:DoxX family protein [Nocardioides sp. R-C-SC26]
MDSTFFELVQFIGRVMFVFLLIGSGIGHLTQTAAMAGYAESRGVSNAKLMVQISGVALIAGGVSILLGIWADLGSLGIAILLIITAVMMHPFWKETDPMNKQMEMVAFNKDIALAGAALLMFTVFRYGMPWTLTDGLFAPSYGF